MTEIQKQIAHLSSEIGELYGADYSTQFSHAINDVNTIESTQIIADLIGLTLDDDYKQKQIKGLKKEIVVLKKDVTELKDSNNILANDFIELKTNNRILTSQMNVLMKNHYNLLLWQAYKNVEYFIIQTVTNYDKNIMKITNTNLIEFMKDPNNEKYVNIIKNQINRFGIDSYSNNLGNLTRNRLNEAHPNPIDTEELKCACDFMETTYPGIDNLYKNYQVVSDYMETR